LLGSVGAKNGLARAADHHTVRADCEPLGAFHIIDASLRKRPFANEFGKRIDA
jgi:hypothetical protein